LAGERPHVRIALHRLAQRDLAVRVAVGHQLRRGSLRVPLPLGGPVRLLRCLPVRHLDLLVYVGPRLAAVLALPARRLGVGAIDGPNVDALAVLVGARGLGLHERASNAALNFAIRCSKRACSASIPARSASTIGSPVGATDAGAFLPFFLGAFAFDATRAATSAMVRGFFEAPAPSRASQRAARARPETSARPRPFARSRTLRATGGSTSRCSATSPQACGPCAFRNAT